MFGEDYKDILGMENLTDYDLDRLKNITSTFTFPPDLPVPYQYDENSPMLRLTKYFIKPAMFTIGFFGNILSIMVFRQKGFQASSSVYLLCFSIFSLIGVIVDIPLVICRCIPETNVIRWFTISYQCYIANYFLDLVTAVTHWLTAIVALERSLIVSKPLISRNFLRSKMARIVCATIIIANALYLIPTLYKCKAVKQSNATETYIVKDIDISNYNRNIAMHVYNAYAILVPFVFVFICNIILVTCMVKKWNMTDNLTADGHANEAMVNANNTQKRSITIIVISTCVLYILSDSVTVFYNIKNSIKGKLALRLFEESIESFYCNTLSASFICLSSLSYLIVSFQYRKNAKEILSSISINRASTNSRLQRGVRTATQSSK